MEDSILIEKCLQQDRKSQKLLFERFSGQMYSICLRYCKDEWEAQEALQNGFIRVFANLGSYRGESGLFYWIKKILIRSALDEIKKRRRDNNILVRDDGDKEVAGAEDTEHMTYEEMLKILHTMPPGYKTIFNMAIIDGMSHQEISQALGVTESTSRTQLMKARNYFKKQMTRQQNLYL